MVIVGVCLAAAAGAAWISIIPWLREHDARVQLQESSNLKSSVEQIKGIEKIADLIRQSNAQWQGIQDASSRTITSAREITDRMKVEAEEFMKFLSKAHDQERAGLRLEVEKLRRMEVDWIKVSVQMLDHVYALFRAGHRSGRRNLIEQLTHFQGACRDVARRIGLVAFVPEPGDYFDAQAHQLTDAKASPEIGARIGEVLAPGFTYQGQLLRRALVLLEGTVPEPGPGAVAEAEAEPAEPLGAQPEESAREEAPSAPGVVPEEPPIFAPEPESPETAGGMEVFESLEQLEPSAEPATPLESEPPKEPAPAEPKKKPPQDELPF